MCPEVCVQQEFGHTLCVSMVSFPVPLTASPRQARTELAKGPYMDRMEFWNVY